MKKEVKHRCEQKVNNDGMIMLLPHNQHVFILHMSWRKRFLVENDGKIIDFGIKGILVLIISLFSTAYWDKHTLTDNLCWCIL